MNFGRMLAWILRWVPLAGGLMGAQVLIQGVNMISGILIVRSLPRETSYAWFTIASSMMAVISLLSDSGTGIAANALGGPVWQDRQKFTQVIQSVMRYRRILSAIASVVAIPWTILLFQRVGARWSDVAILTIIIVISSWPATTAQILGTVNRLHSRYREQVTVEVTSAIARLLLTIAALLPIYLIYGNPNLTKLPPTFPLHYCFVSVVIASCLPSFLNLWLLKKQVSQILLADMPQSYEYDLQIKRTIRHLYPTTIYHCLQGQLGIWLMSIFGTSANVADLGALSRIAILFSIVGAPIGQIAGPSFARCTDKATLQRQFWRVVGCFLTFGAVVLLVATFSPTPILAIIGSQYQHLSHELALIVVMNILSGIYGIQGALVSARGWTPHSYLAIPLGLSSQAILLLLLPLKTVSDLLWFNIFSMIPNLCLGTFMIIKGLRGSYGAFVPPHAAS